MRIYFAGSIRGGREDQAIYAQIIAILTGFGEVLTEHVADASLSALGEDGPTDQFIHDRDLAWLRQCDCVVAEVTTPSLGVGYELGRAVEWGKPVICLYRPQPGRRLSAMLTGNPEIQVVPYETIDQLRPLVSAHMVRIVGK